MDFSSFNIQSALIMFPPLLISLVFHEFAHAYAAKLFGDNTAKEQGRLTLNPLPHIDVFGTILFPLSAFLMQMPFLIGWAKPVPINPSQFSSYRAGLFWVSSAGPGMNFFLGAVSAFLYVLLVNNMNPSFHLYEPFTKMAEFSILINFALGVFNLVPLPPLDGSKVLQAFLPYNLAVKYEQFSQYSFMILMMLLFSGALSYVFGAAQLFAGISLFVAKTILGGA